ncbi:MAG TPA: NADH-quinone oxidoreductase subunit NuoG, partial [Gammaproteobacteria bacterium]
MVEIEINGTPVQARDGAMVLQAADEAGVTIPRFCYHNRLSIAANCRMCLVEVEKVAKPLPACATPVAPGMKIFTRSPKAIAAQRNVMEFLLINHPLDCPICDQGGECDLQEMAMGYGNVASRYSEEKRVVADRDIGPLIATEMTRCIHCTRCVRFGEEIAGIREMGATGRGEHMTIGTYVAKSVDSELSGNIIDLCPVGALTSRPYRFTARPWELRRLASISPHDCVGSHINIDVRGQKVMRVVARENDAINESWIADRDRFSYLGLNHAERLLKPMVKRDGQWQEVDWNSALAFAAEGL